jgi:WD40 repeat protein
MDEVNVEMPEIPALPPTVKHTDFCIVVGSYERYLYGLQCDLHKKQIGPWFIHPAHVGSLRAIATSMDGSLLASGATDEVIRLHDLARRKELGVLMNNNGTITGLQFQGKQHLVSVSEEGLLCIYRVKDWELLKECKGHKQKILGLAIHPSGRLALTIGDDRTLGVFDLTTGKLATMSKLKPGPKEIVPQFASLAYQSTVPEQVLFSPKGEKYTLVFTNRCEIYKTGSDDDPMIIPSPPRGKFNAACYIHFSRDLVIVGMEDKSCRIFDAEDGEELCSFGQKHHNARVKCVSSFLDYLITATSDGGIRLWSVKELIEGGSSVVPLASYEARCRVTCLSICPANRKVATESQESVKPRKETEKPRKESAKFHTESTESVKLRKETESVKPRKETAKSHKESKHSTKPAIPKAPKHLDKKDRKRKRK